VSEHAHFVIVIVIPNDVDHTENLARYQEQTSEIDNPDLLCSAISQKIGISPHSETDGITAFNT